MEDDAHKEAIVEARHAYLRACTYYRAPLFLMAPHTAAFCAIQQQTLVIFTRAEGDEAHCQVNNLALPN